VLYFVLVSDETVRSGITEEWAALGRHVEVDGHRLFVIDHPAGDEVETPVLVLHGFPSCSLDWRMVLPKLAERRRVVLFDFLGFGLSDKPDLRYGIRLHADHAQRIVAALGLDEIALVTHDMGDTVGGELLARSLEGTLGFGIGRRVLTNGSIYLAMAQLTAGQQALMALPDERLGPDRTAEEWKPGYVAGLAGTFSSSRPPSADEMDAQWEMAAMQEGYRLLPRLIRYLEDRVADEARFTGAIESHPSPLGIVWGERDPVAVHPMALRLREARPDAALVTLDGVGHYPMIEDPQRLADAVIATLDGA
jgi:pimeloyl-ACP methyl ester carboxylesterase